MAEARDCYVVPTEPLSEMVSGFVARWQVERPDSGGSGARAVAVTQVGPLQWLAAETGLPHRVVQNVAYARRHTTDLRVADALVTALGCPEAFHDGRLEVQANPRGGRGCCGGSLTGSALERVEALFGV